MCVCVRVILQSGNDFFFPEKRERERKMWEFDVRGARASACVCARL